jgi:hypothetical protein
VIAEEGFLGVFVSRVFDQSPLLGSELLSSEPVPSEQLVNWGLLGKENPVDRAVKVLCRELPLRKARTELEPSLDKR